MDIIQKLKDNKKIVILVVCVVVVIILCYTAGKSGFNSAAGIVARRAQRQVRDDTQSSSSWDLKKLESDVELINRL